MSKYRKHVAGLPLDEALWWFIENMPQDHPERTDIFFDLRERYRQEKQESAIIKRIKRKKPLPHHFMLSYEGNLHDCRVKNWSAKPPLRYGYAHHYGSVGNAHRLKACLRAGPTSDRGAWPMFFVTADGRTMSFEGVRQNLAACLEAFNPANPYSDWRIVRCLANMDDQEMDCAVTGKRIPAAYGTED